MYFVSLYENRRMKPLEIVLRRGETGKRENDGGVNVSTYVNITMYLPVQLLYANKILKRKKEKKPT
jgi:hypothetical protein